MQCLNHALVNIFYWDIVCWRSRSVALGSELCCLYLTMNSEKKCVINTGMESMVRFPANKFEASLQHCCKMNWTAKLHVLQPTFEPVLYQIRLQGFFSWVVKRAALLFNSFCSNAAKQVSCFLLPMLLLTDFEMSLLRVSWLTIRFQWHCFIEVYWVGIVNQMYCW